MKSLRDLVEDNIDMLLYLDDMACVGNPNLEKILVNSMLAFAILPALFGSFTFSKKGTLSINFAIFLLYQLFKYFKHQKMHDIIGRCLFAPLINQGLANFINSPPLDPPDYNTSWKNEAIFSKERDFCKVQ